MRKDLNVSDCWVVPYEDKLFVILINDLNFGKVQQDKQKNILVKPLLDDDFGGEEDDVSNNAFGVGEIDPLLTVDVVR